MGAKQRAAEVGGKRSYPRTARLSALLREVVADELERLSNDDDSLGLLTVTAVEAEPDLRHATVYLATLSEETAETLESHRVRVQAAIARQARLKRTPQLRFKADPAIESGLRIEAVLQQLHAEERA